MTFLASLISSPWAIRPELLPAISRVLGRLARGESASDADRAAVAEGQVAAAGRRQQSARYAGAGGTVAVVPVLGILTQRGQFEDVSTPTTSMSALAATIRTLAADSTIDAIALDVDSPGGSVHGVDELAQAIYEARAAKPVAAVANSLAASAAYWVASQAGELYAAPGAEVGSIGVYTMHADISEALKQDGVAVTLVSAGKFKTETSPYGPLADSAKAYVQASVDSYHDAFVRAVARGRGVSQKAVREGMGQGRVLLPDAAKAERMIDGAATLDQVIGKLQARVAGRDKSAAGMRAFVQAELRRDGTSASSPAPSKLTRDAMQRELDVLELQ